MHLLPVKELNSRLQDQKKSEIDAGIFLARKVDALREEVQELQKERDLFIGGSQKALRDAIRPLEERKDVLGKEIRDLELQRLELKKPLDEEWIKVSKYSEDNRSIGIALQEKSDLLNDLEKNLEITQKTIEDRVENLSYLQGEIKKSLEESENKEKQAEIILKNVLAKELEINTSLEERNKIIISKETDITYREIDIENNLKIIKKKESEQEKEQKHIESQRRALTAAFAELKKKQHG